MKRRLLGVWTETDGVLAFEWTLLLTLLTIGIVGGLAGARDAIIDELGDVAEAAIAFNQSFSYDAVSFTVDLNNDGMADPMDPDDFTFTAAGSVFTDDVDDVGLYSDCTRADATDPGTPDQIGVNTDDNS